MSDKGNSKQEMLERFKNMGIPTPMKPVQNPQAPAKNKEMASKMDQIRNGALRGNFQKFIEKSEKTSVAPVNLPVPKVGKKPSEQTQASPALKSFAPKNSQASMYESVLYGDTPSSNYSQNSGSAGDVTDFGPTHVDTRARLRERIEKRQNDFQTNEFAQEGYANGINLTEAELNEKITNIAKEVSKEMIKHVMLEMSKKNGGIIVESKTVRKAEIVGKNKVKIGGKTYILKPAQ